MTASIPVFITNKMRADLRSQGFTNAEIGKLTPDEAWKYLGGIPEPSKEIEPEFLDTEYQVISSQEPSDSFMDEIPSKPIAKSEPLHLEAHDANWALQDHPKPAAILENIIYPGGVYVFAGEAGDGKSTALPDMGICIANGKSWLNLPTRKTRALYIDQDMGLDWLTLRIASILRGEYCDGSTPFHFISMPGLNLTDKNHTLILKTFIQENQFGLVFLDALVDFLGEADENSSTEMNPIFANIREIANETKAAFTIAHHLNRMGAYRGSSAIKGKVDGLYMLEREKDSPNIIFTPQKVRNGKPKKFAGVFHWEDDRIWMTPTYAPITQEAPLPKAEEYVLHYLRMNPNSPLPDIQAGADICSSKAATHAIYNLANQGKIYRTNPGEKGRGVVAKYDLTPEKDDEINF